MDDPPRKVDYPPVRSAPFPPDTPWRDIVYWLHFLEQKKLISSVGYYVSSEKMGRHFANSMARKYPEELLRWKLLTILTK